MVAVTLGCGQDKWQWLEDISSLSALGRSANRAALAVHHAAPGGRLDDDGREALRDVRESLTVLRDFSAPELTPGRVPWSDLPPKSVFDVMFAAVSRSDKRGDDRAEMASLIADADAVISEDATGAQSRHVLEFLDDLGRSTLAASDRVSSHRAPL